MKPIRFLLTIFAIAVLLMTAGCNNSDTKTADAPSTADKQTQEAAPSVQAAEPKAEKQSVQTEITVYFPDANAEKLIAVKRQVPDNDEKYVSAVNQLIAGPANDSEGIGIMPKGTKVLGVKVDNNTAVVDFSKEFQNNFTGGSTGEIMLVGSIVDTLTEFGEIKSVRFTLEGQPLDILGGHLDLTEPVSRMNDLL